MRKVRRWLFGLLLPTIGATCAFAQSVPVLATTSAGAAIFEQLVAVFEDELRSESGTGPYLAAASELRSMMYAGAVALDLTPVARDERGRMCAYLVGAGGNPRLDGGGNVLAQRPSEFPDPTVVTIGQFPGPMAGWWPEPDRRVVILDDFDLTSLATSVKGLVDTYGEVALQPEDTTRAGLWSALYGYLVALEGPEVDPSMVSVPHGHLVAFHALANLGPNGRITGIVLDRPESHGFRRAILTVEVVGDPMSVREVHLVALDFEDLDGIGKALKDYMSFSEDSVVTSWGFVDCALKERFEEYASGGSLSVATIAEFWEKVFAASDEAGDLLTGLCTAFAEPISEALTDPPDCGSPDGLVGLVTIVMVADVSARSARAIGWNPDGTTRYFASAGNQGLSIPMPPAGWPGVNGVEACVAPDSSPSREKAWFSNAGAVGEHGFVRAVGAWFEPPVRYSGSQGGPLGYWGTSFAAPTAAVSASSFSYLEDPFYFDPCVSP